VFIGSQPIGHDCLQEIVNLKLKIEAVFTFKPEKEETWEKSVDEIAEQNNIPLFYSEELTVEKINEINPDLIIIAGYRKIIPNEILHIPKKGVIGLHASLLPHLRGLAPLNWTIILGDEKAGITLFFMNDGIDTGDIIGQKETNISEKDTIIDLKNRIKSLAVDLIRENIDSILSGKVDRISQSVGGTYGCARIPEDGKIDWEKNNVEIFNLIRASEQSYHAFTFLEDKKIFVTKAELFDTKEKYFGTPGQIGMTFKDGSVLVITGNGILKIIKVKDSTNIEVDAKTFLKSSKLRLK